MRGDDRARRRTAEQAAMALDCSLLSPPRCRDGVRLDLAQPLCSSRGAAKAGCWKPVRKSRRMRLYRRTGWTYAHATRPPKLVTEFLRKGFPRPTLRLSRKAKRYWPEFSAIARLDACSYKMVGFAHGFLPPASRRDPSLKKTKASARRRALVRASEVVDRSAPT
jgi:hypothetical protein